MTSFALTRGHKCSNTSVELVFVALFDYLFFLPLFNEELTIEIKNIFFK